MIGFVIETFERYGYQLLGIFDEVTVMKSETFEDYWVITEGLEAIHRQSEIHDKLADGLLYDYPKFEKNTSMLLLVKENVNYENNMNIEKDPFVFKKYVLNYSDKTFAELEEIVKQYDGVENAVMQEEVFNQLSDANNNSGAALLYGLMHKLPFISVKSKSVGEMKTPMFFSSPLYNEWLGMLNNLTDSADDISHFVDSLLAGDTDEKG